MLLTPNRRFQSACVAEPSAQPTYIFPITSHLHSFSQHESHDPKICPPSLSLSLLSYRFTNSTFRMRIKSATLLCRYVSFSRNDGERGELKFSPFTQQQPLLRLGLGLRPQRLSYSASASISVLGAIYSRRWEVLLRLSVRLKIAQMENQE